MLKTLEQHTPQSLFKNESHVKELETLRNKFALRLQKGIAEHIVKHPEARSIYLYLELKPLFVSGVIFAENGQIPYVKIATFLNEGVSTIRRKITILKKLKLVSVDHKKNIRLATLSRLPILLKLTKDQNSYSKKYRLLNNGETHFTVKQIAIYENLKRQEHNLFQKIYRKELHELLIERMLNPTNSLKSLPKPKDCERYFSKPFLKKFKKYIRDNYDQLKRKYKDLYDKRILQLQFGFPDINPNVTLSYQGIAKIFGRRSKSGAHYTAMQMGKRGMLHIEGNYLTVDQKSAAIYESMCGLRQDIFSYVYRTRKTVTGKHRLYFRNASNTIIPNDNAIFF